MTEATTEQEVSTKVEERRAEERMSPLQQATSQARHEVLSHEQDLLAEGVTREQIQSAAERAGKRVEVEYKEKEAQDPLIRIEKALQEAVETEEDQEFADRGIRSLETFRANWARAIRQTRAKAKFSGESQPSSFHEELQQVVVWDLPPMDSRQREDGLHALVELYYTTPDPYIPGKVHPPSVKFNERFFRAIGVLPQTDSLSDLYDSLPRRSNEKAPGAGKTPRDPSTAERLSTSIPGVEAGYRSSKRAPTIEVNADALQKIIDFPTS